MQDDPSNPVQHNQPAETASRLERLCEAVALIGGALLLATTLITVASVGLRYFFNSPILGDFEIVQVAVAACIAFFLPYCQLKRGNIIVDFFTAGARPRTRRALDALGALLLAAMALLLGVRGMAGGLSMYGTGDTSMLMGIPVWITYALIVPGLLLTGIVAIVTARQALRDGREQ